MVDNYTKRLLYINASKGLVSPLDKYLSKLKEVYNIKIQFNNLINSKLKEYINRLDINYSKLHSLNPYLLLNKGYSLIYKENEIITSISQVEENDNLIINLKDGQLNVEVTSIKKGK